MMIIVDLDGVICTEEKTFERSLAKPQEGALEGMRQLRAQGHTVIVHTARSWAEYRMTEDWLRKNNIEFDALQMGKPIYDVWVDDRAVRFEGWAPLQAKLDSIREERSRTGGVSVAYPADEEFLRENRRVICEFLRDLARQDLPGPILEVGPMVDGRNDPKSVLSRFPEFYLDSRMLFRSCDKDYKSLDIDASAKPDFVGDVSRLDEIMGSQSVGTLIMLSVMEHIPQLWRIPKIASTVLKPGGLLCLQTPWNLRFHGPRPDCWRISDDGYHALFDESFEFVRFNRHETLGRKMMPTCFTAVLKKK